MKCRIGFNNTIRNVLIFYRESESGLCYHNFYFIISLMELPFSMTQLRELESKHHEAVTETAITILEKFTKNELEEGELHDDLRTVRVEIHSPITFGE